MKVNCALHECPNRITKEQMCHHLVRHSAIATGRHRNMGGSSFLTSLLTSLDEAMKRLDEGHLVQVCYTASATSLIHLPIVICNLKWNQHEQHCGITLGRTTYSGEGRLALGLQYTTVPVNIPNCFFQGPILGATSFHIHE